MNEFRTTLWTEVLLAREHGTALDRVFDRYRAPVFQFLQGQGLQAADAEDVAQEVFQRIVERDLLQGADKSKGRFRCLLLAIARNVLSEHRRRRGAQKRGGGKAPAPILPDDAAAPQEEVGFDRIWVANLLGQAVEAASEEERVRGTAYVEVFLESALQGVAQAEIARRRGIQVQDVKNWAHRARKRVSAQLVRLVKEYATSTEEYGEELRLIARYVGEGKPLSDQRD